MSDLQLSLFPAVVVPVGPTGSAGPPFPAIEAPLSPSPAAASFLPLLPSGDGAAWPSPSDVVDPGGAPADAPLRSLLELLPRRIPAEGAEVLASLLGTPVHCRMRRSDRARRLRFVVDRAGSLTLVLPRRFPLVEVPSALREHERWIVRTVERTRARARAPRPRLEPGREIHLFGARHVVRMIAGDSPSQPARVWLNAGEIVVRIPPLHPRTAAQVLRGWLRAHAARVVRGRVEALNGPLGFPLRRVTIRDQRTKWGACSAGGSISINWRLALAPPEVLEYVILHELCHLRELNHSPRFWALLSSLRPGYERQRAWLKENGDDLDV
jgi:predicted metal-dependent hydrolase